MIPNFSKLSLQCAPTGDAWPAANGSFPAAGAEWTPAQQTWLGTATCAVCLDALSDDANGPPLILCANRHVYHRDCAQGLVDRFVTRCPECSQAITAGLTPTPLPPPSPEELQRERERAEREEREEWEWREQEYERVTRLDHEWELEQQARRLARAELLRARRAAMEPWERDREREAGERARRALAQEQRQERVRERARRAAMEPWEQEEDRERMEQERMDWERGQRTRRRQREAGERALWMRGAAMEPWEREAQEAEDSEYSDSTSPFTRGR